MTTAHAYIADLSRERRNTPGSASVYAIVAVCGLECTGADARGDIRCFGLRRLPEVWERAGHNVTCPACRGEVRRLLAQRESPERMARVAALSAWARLHPDGSRTDTLLAEAQRRRVETQRRRKRAQQAANPLCACGRPKVKGKAICGAEACALRRAIEVRRGIR